MTARSRAAARLLPKVQRIVWAIARQLPSHVDREDMYGAACLGLAQALVKFDGTENRCFEAYALRRVRGAVVDHLRSMDVLTRRQRLRLQHMEQAARKLGLELERDPTGAEIAHEARLSQSEYTTLLVGAAARVPVPIDEEDEYATFSGNPDPETLLAVRRELDRFMTARASLRSRLREVMELYYDADLTLREIGKRLGISEGRVSQLHKLAVDELRGSTSPSNWPGSG